MSNLALTRLIEKLKISSPQTITEEIAGLASSINLMIPNSDQGVPSSMGVPAAILIPIVTREEEGLSILLTQRSPHLSSHPGQVSFPGGRLEQSDRTPTDAAIREAREEVGIKTLSVLGELGTYASYSGYHITAVLGLVHPPFEFVANEEEVAQIFEVPLSDALDLKNYAFDHIERHGEKRYFYRLTFKDKDIWGFTGSMMYVLASWLQKTK